jgi:hypothetical protein
VTRLVIGGKKRTDLSVTARDLTLGAAGPGPITATLTMGGRRFAATSVMRVHGTKLLAP